MPLARPYRIGVVAVVIGGIVAGAAVLSSAETHASPRAIPSVTPAPLAVDIGVQKQLAYVLAHWKNYNLAEYGLVGHNDCVDFASQSLIARGWAMDRDWWSKGSGSGFSSSKAWVSSTSLMRYLAGSGRATALTDAQRDKVKLGDIVQFDWDKSGDRDHTGIVTRIEGSGDKVKIYYAGHTDDTDYRSVDWAITVNHPGGLAYYWSIP